jgi:hypothetical protein
VDRDLLRGIIYWIGMFGIQIGLVMFLVRYLNGYLWLWWFLFIPIAALWYWVVVGRLEQK